MKSIPYTAVVGSLMYAQTCTRLDISFAVGMLGRYQSNPRLDHWKDAKKVLKYLQGTKNHMVIGYSYSNLARCIDTRKLAFCYLYLLTGGAISVLVTERDGSGIADERAEGARTSCPSSMSPDAMIVVVVT